MKTDLKSQMQPICYENGRPTTAEPTRLEPLVDIAGALNTALSHPLDFPPFKDAIVDGDRVTIAIESSIPELTAVVEGTVRYLLRCDVTLENISVILSPCSESTRDTFRQSLSEEFQDKLATFIHTPDDASELGYLAATSDEALPIYVNRRLLDADVVLPVSTYRSEESIDYFGFSGLFPLFADAEVIKRCSSLTNLGSASQQSKRIHDDTEAAWLLGIMCVVKVVPAGDGKIQAIVAGMSNKVQANISESYSERIQISLPKPADLAIMEIDGAYNEQTWTNFARALHSGKAAVKNKGTIVIRSRIAIRPSHSLRRLTSLESAASIEKQLSKEHALDTLSASLLSEYLQNNRIFMQCDLPQDAVEDLGVGYIADNQQLERLLTTHARAVRIPSAQHTLIKTA